MKKLKLSEIEESKIKFLQMINGQISTIGDDLSVTYFMIDDDSNKYFTYISFESVVKLMGQSIKWAQDKKKANIIAEVEIDI